MPPLRYTRESQKHIQAVYQFLACKDIDAAKAAVKTIRNALRILKQQPDCGRPTEEYGLEFREWVIDYGNSGYVALYHFDSREVLILAIRHQKELSYGQGNCDEVIEEEQSSD